MKMLKFLKSERNAKVVVLLIALVVLLVPNLLRLIYGSGFNGGSYFYDMLFGVSLSFLNYVILGILLGLVTVYLFFIILGKFKVDLNLRVISCIVLSVSPPFLYLFYGVNRLTLPIFLSLLAFYLFINKNKLFVLSFVLIGFFSPGILILNLFLFFIHMLFRRKEFGIFLKTFVLSFVMILIVYFLNSGIGIFILDGFFRNFISDFGMKFGLGIFGILIGGSGLFFSWKEKKKYWMFYLGFFVLLLLSFRFDVIIFYLNFLLCFLISIAFVSLLNRKWESDVIKTLMIVVMICGLLFSGLSYMNIISRDPSEKFIEGVEFLENRNVVVFSSYENGFLIRSKGNKVILDEVFWDDENVNEKWKDSEKLFKGNNLNEALEIIGKYDIKYVFIDVEMKRKIWDNKQEGLLFILSNHFEKVFDNNVVEIWEVS